MSRRSGGHNGRSVGGGGVGLFPFLAVLLCTMGGLLVLLVVMAEQARKAALAEQAAVVEPQQDDDLVENLLRQVESAEAMVAQAELLLEQAEERLEHERARLAHSEEHQRRLEKELAELALSAKQLEQTEEDASVDQQQAEAERDRLREILADTEQQIEELREQGVGEKSFAIVPYAGPNGTRRQPIYVECLENELVIHPEGVQITSMDLVDPGWPGNPLAAALRASRELLNQRALESGLPDPPDPYPLLIVRPKGNRMYHQARTAIQSWDSDYGYEFVEQDRRMIYPVAPDAGLAQAQQHAVINARERLVSRVNAAPSRYRNHLAARASGSGLGGGIGGMVDDSPLLEEGSGGYGTSSSGDQLGEPGEAGTPTGEPLNGQIVGQTGEAQEGESGQGGGPSKGFISESNEYVDPNQGSSESSVAGSQYGEGGTTDSGGDVAGGVAGGGSPTPPSGAGAQVAAAGAASSGPQTQQQGVGASGGGGGPPARNRRGATPIQRIIRLEVGAEQAVAVTKDNEDAANESVAVLGTDRELSERFSGWIRDRVEGWGLAGAGLYWKPVVVLDVRPEGQQHAARLTKLIEYHGVEVRVERTAQRTEAADASRR